MLIQLFYGEYTCWMFLTVEDIRMLKNFQTFLDWVKKTFEAEGKS